MQLKYRYPFLTVWDYLYPQIQITPRYTISYITWHTCTFITIYMCKVVQLKCRSPVLAVWDYWYPQIQINPNYLLHNLQTCAFIT